MRKYRPNSWGFPEANRYFRQHLVTRHHCIAVSIQYNNGHPGEGDTILGAVRRIVRWYCVVGARLLRRTPAAILCAISASLLSQVAVFLAFFLPLKVIFLLGTGTVPHYFPHVLHTVSMHQLTLALCVMALLSYLMHKGSEQTIGILAKRGADRLLAVSGKIPLFANQEDIAALACQRYARSAAALAWVFMVLLGLAFFWPSLSLLITGYWAAAWFVTQILYHTSQTFAKSLEAEFSNRMQTLAAIGFLLVFFWLVASFPANHPKPPVLKTVVGLLLARQAMQQVVAFVTGLWQLQVSRFQIDSLFFHRQAALPASPVHAQNIWDLAAAGSRSAWMTEALESVRGRPVKVQSVAWHPARVHQVLAFEVHADSVRYLVRVFSERSAFQARHERALFEGIATAKLPALRWVGACSVQGFSCHVHALDTARMLTDADIKVASVQSLIELMRVAIPPRFADSWRRSKPLLWQRLDTSLFTPLSVVFETDCDLQQQLQWLEAELEGIREMLQGMPLQVVNPAFPLKNLVLRDTNDRFLFAHWGGWSLEPLGAGWPVPHLSVLREKITDIVSDRQEVAGILPQQVCAAALLFALERHCQMEQFEACAQIIPQLVACLQLK